VAPAKPTVAPARAVTRATTPAAVPPSQTKVGSGMRYNDLMTAVLYRDVDAVNELLKLGKWVDKPDSHGTTPLMVAAQLGDVRTAEALLRAGADARRAVPVAKERGDGEMLELLKRYNAR
jgi:ankyrin repeat protein